MPSVPLPPRRLSLVGPISLVASVGAHAAAVCFAIAGWGHRASVPTPVTVAPRDAEGALSGETFEIPTDLAREPEEPTRPADPGSVMPGGPPPASANGSDAPQYVSPASAHAETPLRRRSSTAATPSAVSTDRAGNDEPSAPARYGATGDRSAVDLAAAFTRGFPQAASADPVWLDAPFGSAGTVDVDLTLDESGALVGTHASGTAGAALSQALRRTLALLRSRAFVAAGKETHLRVTATVTADAVHDGLHGEVFAIGGSFEGLEGSAFFALAVGRRVDIRIRVVR